MRRLNDWFPIETATRDGPSYLIFQLVEDNTLDQGVWRFFRRQALAHEEGQKEGGGR